MDSKTLCFLSLSDLSAAIRKREVSSVEATRAVLERIRELNPKLRAYLTVMDASALKQAEAADKEIAAGKYRGPLHGVPIAVKDLCWTKGVATTCASKLLRDFKPDANGTVVQRFEDAGAVLLGKLHLTEFAMAWYHPEIPGPLNPWNPDLWPGASSSGSGAATAAGLCYASIGTDTGGSIRFPSAANGIVGLKPTWGRVSRYGVFALSESFDHVGPMTRTVADAATVLSVIAGQDPNDDTSLAASLDDYPAAAKSGAFSVTLGFDEKYVARASNEVATAVGNAVRDLERVGVRVVKVKVPDVDPVIEAWSPMAAAEALAAHSTTYPSKASEYGPGFRSLVEMGAKVTGVEYANSNMVRARFTNQFQQLFDKIDLLACPSMMATTLPANAMPPDASAFKGPNPLMSYTAPYNMSRNPTLSLPCGDGKGGPPPSLQLVGRLLGEATLFRVGGAFERATEWHKQRPTI